ncbi:MAG: hypothetical protein EOP06_19615, partial [Proteobacteria bacterium]
SPTKSPAIRKFHEPFGMNQKTKLTNRLLKLATDAIFTGKYTYLGVTKADFKVPVGNARQSATDWSVSSTATPMKDLYALQTTDPLYMRYKILEYVISPATHAAILNSEEVRKVLVNNSNAVGDINMLRTLLYPGLAPFKVVADSYQLQTTAVDGSIINGNTTYFVPDWKILAVPDFSGTLYGAYGEIQMTYNMNDPAATPEKPAMGVYSFVDELGLLQRKNPHVEVVTGFNGGSNLMRSNDVLIITVKAGV